MGCDKIRFNISIFAILSVIIAVFVLAGSVSAADIDANATDIVSAVDNDEIADVGNDSEVSGENEGTYSDLRQEIGKGKDVNLTKSYYRYVEGDKSTIEIDNSCTINGNGAVIDMGLVDVSAFNVRTSGVTFKNLTIKNVNYKAAGGAIYFGKNGTVTDCNFISNSASAGGAIYFSKDGAVTNCNFTDNSANDGGAIDIVGIGAVTNCNFVNNAGNFGGAIRLNYGTVRGCNFTNNFNIAGSGIYYGGAIYFYKNGSIVDCNFDSNSAPIGGAISFNENGTVINCNFTDNYASRSGGALRFESAGNVIGCKFTGNNATSGSAIYFSSKTANKTVSNSIFLNNRANVDDRTPLQITKNETNIVITFRGNDNLLNAIYSHGDVSFANVTYWGANGTAITNSTPVKSNNNVAGQNITVIMLVNDDIVMDSVKTTDSEGRIVLDLSGDVKYFIYVCHDEDSYYTWAEKTMTNMDFSVNVTGVTTNRGKVNITAKTSLKNELIEGKLNFTLANGTEIPANYDNGIWWALYTFADYGEYNVSASYVDGVTVNGAVIRYVPFDTAITASDKAYVINYGGTYSAVVKDSNGNAVSGERVTFTLNGKNIGTVVTNDKGVASIKLTSKILKYAKTGKKNLVMKFSVTDGYKSTEKTVKITINKEKTKIVAKKKTFRKSQKVKKYTITLKNSKGKAVKKVRVTLKVKGKTYTAKTNAKGKAVFKIKKLTKKGKHKATLTYKGNACYSKATKKVWITVR